MNDFAFVVVSYNQENYVLQHLRSIKYQIENYGANRKIQIVFSDDCSKDNTVQVAEKWIRNNSNLFSDITFIQHKQNVGTIRNMCEAISAVDAKAYKSLACDDLYFSNNIFELNELADIVLTPIISFWNNGDIEPCLIPDYCTILRSRLNKKIKIRKMLKYNQCIQSPGVFMKQRFWLDKGFQDYLKQFRYIEDILEWDYIFCGKFKEDFSIIVSNKPYILYRRGVGVSENILRLNNNTIDREYASIREIIPAREDIRPIILNPYRIIHYFVIHFINKIWLKKEKINHNLSDWEKGIENARDFLTEVININN